MLLQVKLLLKNVKRHIFTHIIIDFKGFPDVRRSAKTHCLTQNNFRFLHWLFLNYRLWNIDIGAIRKRL